MIDAQKAIWYWLVGPAFVIVPFVAVALLMAGISRLKGKINAYRNSRRVQ